MLNETTLADPAFAEEQYGPPLAFERARPVLAKRRVLRLAVQEAGQTLLGWLPDKMLAGRHLAQHPPDRVPALHAAQLAAAEALADEQVGDALVGLVGDDN